MQHTLFNCKLKYNCILLKHTQANMPTYNGKYQYLNVSLISKTFDFPLTYLVFKSSVSWYAASCFLYLLAVAIVLC